MTATLLNALNKTSKGEILPSEYQDVVEALSQIELMPAPECNDFLLKTLAEMRDAHTTEVTGMNK